MNKFVHFHYRGNLSEAVLIEINTECMVLSIYCGNIKPSQEKACLGLGTKYRALVKSETKI